MNSLSNDPRETAAVLHGILAGPIAPTVAERAAMEIPALVIGHRVDHVHPFHDAEQLARRLPQGQLIQANSVLELRIHPERLTDRDQPAARHGLGRHRPGHEQGRLRSGPPARAIAYHRSSQSSGSGRRARLRSDSRRLDSSLRSVAPFDGRVGRRAFSTRRAAARRSRKRSVGQLAVAELRPLVVGHHPDLGTDPLEQPGPLMGTERGGAAPRRSAAPPGCSPCLRADRRDRRSG